MKLKFLGLLTIVSLLAGVFAIPYSNPVAAGEGPATATAEVAGKVQPLVLQEIAAQGATDFFVWMTEKADLSPAAALQTKQEKGRFVFDTLVATADRTQAALRQSLDAQGVDYQPFYIANKIFVRGAGEALLLAIAARPDVAEITANHQFQLQEPFVDPDAPISPDAIEPNITFINADDVWTLGYHGEGTVMAGNDTGLDWDHPALINQYRGWNGSVADHNYNWWDATGTYPTVPNDGHGHGTHTTGTMVGDDGADNQIGVAPGAQTVHCKNMTDGGSGSDVTFTTCFQWDLAPWDLSGANPDPDLAPDAINNSWGYWGGGQNQFRDEIQNLHAAGILVEVSAGNEGTGCGTLRSPGDYWEVMTTGSVNHVSGVLPGTLTGFSSRGPSLLDPGDYFPDIMAPGENIRSSYPGGTYQGGWSGTSMSGPHATALVGLMWSACPAFTGRVADTLQIIIDTAVPLTGQGGSNCGGDYVDGPNNDWGFGAIDALAAVNEVVSQCGAQGHLDGTVTDDFTGDPIEGATVVADWHDGGEWPRLTDAAGYYTFTIPAGLYDVTASHPHYTALTVIDVVVVTDTVTTQDFSLVPKGLLSGYVTDADNGFPLVGATVAADDGTEASTDADGYYELYLDAGSYDVTAAAPNYAPETATVAIVSGETTNQDFSLLAAIAFTPAPAHVTLDWQTTGSLDATLTNRLPEPYPFEFREGESTFTPLAQPSVLLVCSDYQPLCEPIRAQLQAYGDLAVVDAFDAQLGTPSLAVLEPYDVVLTWSNYTYADPVGIGNVLADYVDGGGTVINLMFAMGTHGWQMQGRFMTENYTAMNGTSLNFGNICLGTYNAGHPIMDGVTDVCEYYRMTGTYLTAGSSDIAQWADGLLFVAAKDDQTVVSINGYVGGAASWTGQMDDVVHNAILWLQGAGADVPWFGQDPITGTVPAESSIDVTLLFTATHDVGVHQPGDYQTTLKVNGDPSLEVPVVMTVLPAADMGKVEGTITDICTGDPVEGVLVAFDDVYTTTTGADGTYTYWLVEGSYLVTATAPDYLAADADVDIVAGETAQQDFALTPLRPCLDVSPDLLEVWVITGTLVYTHPTGIEIINRGGVDLDFDIIEIDGVPQANVRLAPRATDLPLATGPAVAPAGASSAEAVLTPAAPRLNQGSILHIYTTNTGQSIQRALNELGYGYDLFSGDDWTAIDFGPYDTVIIGMDGGLVYEASLAKIRSDVVDQGKRVIFMGGTCWQPFALGVNQYLVLNNTNDYCWTVSGTPHWTLTDPDHGLADGLPGSYNFTNSSAAYYALRATDPDIEVVGINGDGYDELFYKNMAFPMAGGNPTQDGDLIWFINSVYEYYWTNQADFDVLKQMVENALTYSPVTPDVPWFWEEPITGTVSAGSMLPVDVWFTTVVTDPLPLGTYTATLRVRGNDPVQRTQDVLVLMHIIEDYEAPIASFESNAPVKVHEEVVFTNTTIPGIPPETTYLWDFGDGTTSTLEHPTHIYPTYGWYTVTLEACNAQLCDEFVDMIQILPLELWLPVVLRNN